MKIEKLTGSRAVLEALRGGECVALSEFPGGYGPIADNKLELVDGSWQVTVVNCWSLEGCACISHPPWMTYRLSWPEAKELIRASQFQGAVYRPTPRW